MRKAMRSRFAAVAFAAMMLNGSAAFALDPTSANHLLRFCKLWIADAERERLSQGICFGTVNGVAAIAPNVCAPDGATSGQILQVVVRYVEQRPARHHEMLARLSLEALQSAWPCRK